jgi:hypothetical protein
VQERWDIRRAIQDDVLNYTVKWSPWGSMDRWIINRIVPSEAGLFQLWALDGRGLVLLTTEPTYYGGLRNSLREAIDDLAPSCNRLRKIINDRECWFRFSISSVREYLENLKTWYSQKDGAFDDDNREIFVNEIETMKKFPPVPPDVKIISRERMKDSDFGPPMPTPGK